MNLKELIIRHEGWRNRRYLCPAGRRTIGVGWNMDAWPLPHEIASYERVNGFIPDDMIDRLLDISIDTATLQCRSIFPGFDKFSEARRFALIDMAFTLGGFGLLGFRKMRKAISAGDWNEAAEQARDSAYWRQLGGDPKGTDDGKLERPEEIAIMLRGDEPMGAIT